MPRRPNLDLAREAVRLLGARANTAPRPLDEPSQRALRGAAAKKSLAERFLAFDDRLASLGVPRLTDWWRERIGAWLDAYEQRNVLELLACVGRGAAKSTALYELALFFALYGDFVVPPGERHYASIISARLEDARKGLRIIPGWLDLLGIPYAAHGAFVDLEGLQRGLMVVAANVRAASGPRCFFVGKDERSKWAESGLSTEDADEVDTSAVAMTATHARAPILSFGSAWMASGAFYDQARAGSSERCTVIGPAPTWVAAPHISEASTRMKERNPARWRREYACEFQEGNEDGLYTAAMLDAVQRSNDADVPREPGVTYVAAMDPGFVANAWTFCIAALRRCGSRLRRSVVLVREWKGAADKPNDPRVVLGEIAGYCRAYGVAVVESDAAERFSLATIGRELGVTVNAYDHGAVVPRYEALLTWIVDGEVELPAHPVVRRDLLAVRQKFTATGTSIVLPTTPDGRHCDYAPSVQLAIAACLTEPDDRAKMTEDERIEQAALQIDLDAFAPKKGKDAQAWWQRDPLRQGASYSPAHERLERARRRR